MHLLDATNCIREIAAQVAFSRSLVNLLGRQFAEFFVTLVREPKRNQSRFEPGSYPLDSFLNSAHRA